MKSAMSKIFLACLFTFTLHSSDAPQSLSERLMSDSEVQMHVSALLQRLPAGFSHVGFSFSPTGTINILVRDSEEKLHSIECIVVSKSSSAGAASNSGQPKK